MPFTEGDLIRVEFDGIIQKSYDNDGTGKNNTSLVQERNAKSSNHFIFLPSNLVTGGKDTGDTVHVAFTARITGSVNAMSLATTEVREVRENGYNGFTHFIFLNSPSVTALPAPAAPVMPFLAKEPRTMEIDSINTIIDENEVESRITEIEDSQAYEVIRLRNDEVLGTFNDQQDAEQYIQDEDYNPERVIVRQQQLNDDETRELSLLRALRDKVTAELSSGWTLYNESYFDEDWAKSETREVLGSRVSTDAWPLSEIDWDDAAVARRDDYYPNEYTYDGVTFYARED